MKHILKSGIEVEDEQYYKLLEWKDINEKEFILWCDSCNVGYSINNLCLSLYNALLLFAGFD